MRVYCNNHTYIFIDHHFFCVSSQLLQNKFPDSYQKLSRDFLLFNLIFFYLPRSYASSYRTLSVFILEITPPRLYFQNYQICNIFLPSTASHIVGPLDPFFNKNSSACFPLAIIFFYYLVCCFYSSWNKSL
eukprot:EC095223.1.p2 GENE.EC095223.1~~EC095223.1.p2  ORF type:complete len:131 (-),score=11.82 EC095223.1:103-495(-)